MYFIIKLIIPLTMIFLLFPKMNFIKVLTEDDWSVSFFVRILHMNNTLSQEAKCNGLFEIKGFD